MKNKNNDVFSVWFRENRYTTLFGAFFAILSGIVGNIIQLLPNTIHLNSNLGNALIYNFHHIVNIAFLLYIFIRLSRESFTMNSDKQKEKSLHEYVKMVFGESSTLAQNTPEDLYKRLKLGVMQFFYSWMAVWGVWLILYILIFVFSVWKYQTSAYLNDSILDLSDMPLFRFGSLLENFLNLINSFILLFIYLVITVSTVQVGSLTNENPRIMHASCSVLILIGACCLFVDLFSLSPSINAETYKEIQYYLRLVIGVIAAISFMAVLGRLNTNFLNIPQWMMLSLYLYAAIQIIYPFTYDPYYFRPGKQIIIEDKDNRKQTHKNNLELPTTKDTLFLFLKCSSNNEFDTTKTKIIGDRMCCCINRKDTILTEYICSKTPEYKNAYMSSDSYKEEKHREIIEKKKNLFPHIDILENMLFYFALLGKAFLFSVLLWINRKNRFLFFLIHKANTLSDSEIMLRRFNKFYSGHMDKEDE